MVPPQVPLKASKATGEIRVTLHEDLIVIVIVIVRAIIMSVVIVIDSTIIIIFTIRTRTRLL